MDAYWAAPPVIRTLTAAVVATSLAVHIGPLSAYHIVYLSNKVFSFTPELWRLVTSFLLTGPKLSLILDPFFLYTTGRQLEEGSPRFSRKGDFFVYIVFVMATILLKLAATVPEIETTCAGVLGGVTYLPALTMSFAYTLAQDNPETLTTLFFFQLQAKWLPYAMLAITFLMAGPQAMYEEATGIFAAHLYEFLTRIWPRYGGGTNLVTTPAFISQAFGDNTSTPKTRAYGTAFSARPPAAGNSASTTGFQAWNSRGPGRRLG